MSSEGWGELFVFREDSESQCPFHALAFEIECDNRASQATELIHPELARGHSNLLEASYKCPNQI